MPEQVLKSFNLTLMPRTPSPAFQNFYPGEAFLSNCLNDITSAIPPLYQAGRRGMIVAQGGEYSYIPR
jgi:hypothetical protein